MGQRRSKWRAARFQGIPGGVARGSIPGRVATSYPTPVGSQRRWCYLKSFVYTRVAWQTAYTRSNQDSVYTRSLPRFYLYQVISRFFLYQVTSKILFIPGDFKDSVYTRSFPDFVYNRWCSFTHTSVRGAASAWAADTHQSSDCDGVCGTAFMTRICWAMTLVGGDWYHRSPQL